MVQSRISNYMSNFNKAIEEQLRMLYEAPRRRPKNKNKVQSRPCPSTTPPRRITTGTGTGEGSGV